MVESDPDVSTIEATRASPAPSTVWIQRGLVAAIWIAAIVGWQLYRSSNDLSTTQAGQEFIDTDAVVDNVNALFIQQLRTTGRAGTTGDFDSNVTLTGANGRGNSLQWGRIVGVCPTYPAGWTLNNPIGRLGINGVRIIP